MKRLLLTRSRHDIGNEYLFHYSEEIAAKAIDGGWQVDDVKSEKATKAAVQKRLGTLAYEFAIFNGHGSDSSICGHNNETLVDQSSASLLSNKVCFSRSCCSAKHLGDIAVSKGSKAFIGYSREFIVPRVNSCASRPLQDPAARPVLESSNAIPISLLHGKTAKEAVDSSQAHAEKLILKLLPSEEPYDGAALRALINNQSCIRICGDEAARA